MKRELRLALTLLLIEFYSPKVHECNTHVEVHLLRWLVSICAVSATRSQKPVFDACVPELDLRKVKGTIIF